MAVTLPVIVWHASTVPIARTRGLTSAVKQAADWARLGVVLTSVPGRLRLEVHELRQDPVAMAALFVIMPGFVAGLLLWIYHLLAP